MSEDCTMIRSIQGSCTKIWIIQYWSCLSFETPVTDINCGNKLKLKLAKIRRMIRNWCSFAESNYFSDLSLPSIKSKNLKWVLWVFIEFWTKFRFLGCWRNSIGVRVCTAGLREKEDFEVCCAFRELTLLICLLVEFFPLDSGASMAANPPNPHMAQFPLKSYLGDDAGTRIVSVDLNSTIGMFRARMAAEYGREASTIGVLVAGRGNPPDDTKFNQLDVGRESLITLTLRVTNNPRNELTRSRDTLRTLFYTLPPLPTSFTALEDKHLYLALCLGNHSPVRTFLLRSSFLRLLPACVSHSLLCVLILLVYRIWHWERIHILL
jgi:hypothetical protein